MCFTRSWYYIIVLYLHVKKNWLKNRNCISILARVEGIVSLWKYVSAGTSSGRGSRSRSRGRGSSPSWSQHFDHLTRIWNGVSDRSSRGVNGTVPWSPPQGVLSSLLDILTLFALHDKKVFFVHFHLRHKLWYMKVFYSVSCRLIDISFFGLNIWESSFIHP